MTKLLSHNDSPTEIDALGQKQFIQDIVDVIRFSIPPKGIAINGYWGIGKTSALKQLKNLLGEDVVSVWFEAWRYQNEQMPIIALLHSIKEEFNLRRQLFDQAKKLASVTVLGVLGAFDEVIKAASGGFFQPKLGEIAKIGTDYEKEHYLNPLQSFELNKLLQDAIDVALGNDAEGNANDKKKLVIFIDDLDRCNPEAALKLLEGIKVFLSLDNCVIVFAIDQRQIECALNKALTNAKAEEHYAREYLEKICQDIYHLPLPSPIKKSKFFIDLVRQLLASDPAVSRTKVRQHLREMQAVLANYDCLPANPRKIKALANRVAMILRRKSSSPILAVLTTPRAYCLLIATAIIYTFHRELNEQLQKNPLLISKVLTFSIDPSGLDETITSLMVGIKPSQNATEDLPVNPSDSNVFRLHKLFIALGVITESELIPFLGL